MYTPPSNQLKASKSTDWNICVLFQDDTEAALQFHLAYFSELGRIPMKIDIARVDDGYGIEATEGTLCWMTESMLLESQLN